MILRIHHVQITIPSGSERVASEFYCGVLGLIGIQRPAILMDRSGLWLSVGDCQLHIGIEDGVDRRATKAHVAFEVSSLETLRQSFQQSRIEIYDSLQIPGYTRFEIRDPFGNRLEFLERVEQ